MGTLAGNELNYLYFPQVPELAENFTLVLYNVSGGEIDDLNSTTVVMVPPNDDICGVFEFARENYVFNEHNGVYSVTIFRNKGTYGKARVYFEIVASVNNSFNARMGVDLEINSSYVDFADGESNKRFDVIIIDDDEAEIDEEALLRIIKVDVESVEGTVQLSPILCFDSKNI